MADDFRNSRLPCGNSIINNFDLSPWIERDFNEITKFNDFTPKFREAKRRKLKRPTTKNPKTTRTTPKRVKLKNVTTHTIQLQQNKQTYNTGSYGILQRPSFDSYNDKRTTLRDDSTYLFGVVSESTTQIPAPNPFEVNIKIQYYPPSTTERHATTKKKRKYIQTRQPYHKVTTKPIYSYDYAVYKPTYIVRPQSDFYPDRYEDQFSTIKPHRPNNDYVYTTKATHNHYSYSKRPSYETDRDDSYDKLYSDVYSSGNMHFGPDQDDIPRPIKHYSIGHVEKLSTDHDYDQFDFYSSTNNRQKTKFVKISSVKGHEFFDADGGTVDLHVAQREGDFKLDDKKIDIRIVDLAVTPAGNKWLVYNATEEVIELLEFPNINCDVSYTDELPKPMNASLFTNDYIN